MPNHAVTLNYEPNPNNPNKPIFTATPKRIQVKPGDTISFKLGNGPANGKIRVTFKATDAGFFSVPVFKDGDAPVVVNTELAALVIYFCELFVDLVKVAESSDAGGEIEPAPRT